MRRRCSWCWRRVSRRIASSSRTHARCADVLQVIAMPQRQTLRGDGNGRNYTWQWKWQQYRGAQKLHCTNDRCWRNFAAAAGVLSNKPSRMFTAFAHRRCRRTCALPLPQAFGSPHSTPRTSCRRLPRCTLRRVRRYSVLPIQQFLGLISQPYTAHAPSAAGLHLLYHLTLAFAAIMASCVDSLLHGPSPLHNCRAAAAHPSG